MLLVSANSAFAASDTMTINGNVVDGTAGASLPSGLVAHLTGVDNTTHAAVVDQSAPVDAAGRFSFPRTSASANAAYAVTVSYGGVAYQQPVSVNGATAAPVTVTIYETTTSDSAIQLASANWVFEGFDTDNQQVAVLETLTVVNAGDRTFVGDHRGDPGSDAPGVAPRTLRLPLTQGASGFTPQEGLDPSAVLPVAGGFVDTSPILPGSHDVAYTYLLAYADGGAEIRNALPYPTKTLRFFAPNAGLDIRSDHLTTGSTATIQGKPYVIASADNIPANTVVTVDVFGLPSTPSGRLDPTVMRIAGIAVIVLALLVALFFGLRPRRSIELDRLAERETLLLSLARLDNSYAAGQIPADFYRETRAAQKRKLVDLILGERASPDSSGATG
jgi:hypothetical protein